ncbi:MAG TPA: CoA-binding protein [Dongiaceae bacterium]|jgi:predicted CoA-binding protein|nr:CoA-binding protein [Dongiaceae bacterium]
MSSDELIREIAENTRIIALVGASPNPARPSNDVMRFLQKAGYRVIPINPGHASEEINGEQVYARLEDIPQDLTGRVDMVDIFRNSADAAAPTESAIKIGARYVWMQLGVINSQAALKAEQAGLKVVMNRCPAIEFPRLGIRRVPV